MPPRPQVGGWGEGASGRAHGHRGGDVLLGELGLAQRGAHVGLEGVEGHRVELDRAAEAAAARTADAPSREAAQ